MTKCDYCGSSILFGGVRDGNLRFCNERCYNKGYLLMLSHEIPQDILQHKVNEVRQGLCPKCEGTGPVNVHTSHRVWSALFLTSWSSKPQICCRRCGMKSQIGNAMFSFLFGWWGFPWGFIYTPVQVIRNIIGMLKGSDETRSSGELEKLVRIHIAAQVIAAQQEA